MRKKKSKIKNQKVKEGRFVGNFVGGWELRNFPGITKIRNPYEFDKACTTCSASAFAFFYAFQL